MFQNVLNKSFFMPRVTIAFERNG